MSGPKLCLYYCACGCKTIIASLEGDDGKRQPVLAFKAQVRNWYLPLCECKEMNPWRVPLELCGTDGMGRPPRGLVERERERERRRAELEP